MSVASKLRRIGGLIARPTTIPYEIRRSRAVRRARSVLAQPPNDVRYYSQYGQDRYLDQAVFKGKRGGVFVDVGAHDGETYSNSCFFERQRGWTGVCVEPHPTLFPLLKARRSAKCVNCCIGPDSRTAPFTVLEGEESVLSGIADRSPAGHDVLRSGGAGARVIEMPVRTLADVLAEADIGQFDLLSLDMEGGELDVLKSFDLSRVSVVCVENSNDVDRSLLQRHMLGRGFALHAILLDEVYVRAELL